MVIESPPPPSEPEEIPPPTPDQVAMGLRRWFRMVVGVVLIIALLTCIVVGIYRVLEATKSG